MATYNSDSPQMIVNGFIRSGIPGALDGLDDVDDTTGTRPEDEETDSDDFEESEDEPTDCYVYV